MKVKQKISAKEGRLQVTVKLDNALPTNPRELELVNGKGMRGLMHLDEAARKKFVYSGPIAISLADRMEMPVPSTEFLFVVAQLIELSQRMGRYNLQLCNLVLNYNNIYISGYNKFIQLLYLPVMGNSFFVDLRQPIIAMAHVYQADSQKSADAVTAFCNFLCSRQEFKADEALDKLYEIDTAVAELMSKATYGSSGFLTANNARQGSAPQMSAAAPAGFGGTVYGDDTGLLSEEEAKAYAAPAAAPVFAGDGDATGLLMEDVPAQPAYSAPAQPAYSAPAQPAYSAPAQESFLGTGEGGETGLLMEDEPAQPAYNVPAQPAYSTPAQPTYNAPAQQGYSYGGNSNTGYSVPAQPAYSAPAQPAYSAPAQQGYSYGGNSNSGYSVPAQPAYSTPAQPAYSAPAQQGYSYGGNSNSGYSVPAQPAYSAPAQQGYSYGGNSNSGYSAPAQQSYSAPVQHEEYETTFLNDSDTYSRSGRAAHYPTLKRVSTGETIEISRGSFRLGKDPSAVDYCITGNSAISRSHADIITRGNSCYIVDLNSKNRSFVNEIPVVPNAETPIKTGDRIRLADEDFTFAQ